MNKAEKIAELKADIETLKTMPAGELMPGDGRAMKENRRARYVAEGQGNLMVAMEAPEKEFSGMKDRILFNDNFYE